MHRIRRELIAAMNYRFKGQCTQELLLRYQLRDSCDCQMSAVVEIPVVYGAGLEGSWSNLESERSAIQFQAHREVNWVSPFGHAAAITTAGIGAINQTYTTTVTYEGDEDAWVTFEIRGGSDFIHVDSIENLTTGAFLGFVDLTIPADYFPVGTDDYAIIHTDPRALSIQYFPGGSRQMFRVRCPESQMSAMRLVPGENVFEVVVPYHGDDSLVLVRWHDHYSSTDVIPMCDACTGNYL